MHFIANHLLAQHPDVREQLRQYATRCFAIQSMGMFFVAQIDETGHLKASDTPPDCQIQLHDSALQKLFKNQKPVAGDLTIVGDYALAMALLPLLAQLDYSLAADLRRFGADDWADCLERTRDDVRLDLADGRDWLNQRISQRVLQAEQPLALHRVLFAEHTAQMADLRDDVARLEARLRLLEQANRPSGGL